MASNRLINDSWRAIQEELALPLGPDAAPVELSADEQNWQSADWAWFFLSRNGQYRDAYQEHATGEDLDLVDVLDSRTERLF